jgi:hypothetical protein
LSAIVKNEKRLEIDRNLLFARSTGARRASIYSKNTKVFLL